MPWSCSPRVCGSCVTPVLEGEVEHRSISAAVALGSSQNPMVATSMSR
ncbi:MAG: 2Fe-2S iron-sulfur cluster-binding protein [Sporichthyaceae bacterium]